MIGGGMLGGGGMTGGMGGGPQDAPDLGALLGNPSGPPLPNDLAGAGAPPEAPDQLSALQDAIHSTAAAIAALTDPQDTQDAISSMHGLSKIQTRLMQKQAPGA